MTDVKAMRDAAIRANKEGKALTMNPDGIIKVADRLEAAERALHNGRDRYNGMVEQCQEFDIQTGVLSSRLIEAKKERDTAIEREQALAAHVRALVEWADSYVGTTGLYEEVEAARKADTDSLAKLIAEKQAEALEKVLSELRRVRRDEPTVKAMNAAIDAVIALRRQAEDPTA